MKKEIKVAISNRHVHLCRKDFEYLFGKNFELTKRNDLNQKGEFASNQTVILKTDKNIIENVRVVGPIRNYTQVEISWDDSQILGLNPPIRDSGDLQNSSTITIIGPKNELKVQNCCIQSVNHIHASNEDLINYENNSQVNVITKDNKVITNVHIKRASNYVLEMHVDKYNAKIYGLEDGDVVTLENGD